MKSYDKNCSIDTSVDATGSFGRSGSFVRKMVMTSLMAAVVFVATSLVKIPTIATQGYVHLGDAAVFISVLLLGRKQGAAAGAIGSGLSDLLGGYVYWAPWTFIIKGVMALVFARIAGIKDDGAVHRRDLHMISAYIVSGAIMVAGYYVSSAIMYGNWASPLASVPWNILQAVSGAVISAVMYAIVSKRMR